MEREVKLRMIVPQKSEVFLESKFLVPFVSKKSKKVMLEATYYDTADHQLLESGYAYRVRKEGRQWVGTLKDEGSYSGGLHERQEWNIPQKNDTPDLEVFKETGLSKKWKDLNGKSLVPLFQVKTERTIQELTLEDGTQVEMALDFGTVFTEEKKDHLQEVELELISGSIASLLSLAALISKEWKLAPEKRSKYSRGLELAGLSKIESSPAPFVLDDDLPAPEGMLLLVESQVGHLLRLVEKGYRKDFSIKWIHDFRVQLRQLRSLLMFIEPFCLEGQMEEWRLRIKECFGKTGPIREMDVLLELVEEIPDKEIGSGTLARRIQKRRVELLEEWKNEWSQGQLTSLFLAFWACLEENLVEKDTQKPYWKLEKWAIQIMNEEVRKMWQIRNERHFEDFEWSHELRIEAKKLRYSLESLAEYLPIRETSKLLNSLEELQEILGRIQDSYCSTDWIQSLADRRAPHSFYYQSGIVRGWLLKNSSTAVEEAEYAWEKTLKRIKKWLKYVEG